MELEAAVAAVPVVVIRQAQPRLRLVAAQDHQLLVVVPVQVHHLIPGIGGGHQPQGLQALRGVYAHGLDLGAGPPADNDLLDAVPVHILIAHAMEGGAGALNERGLLIILT